MKKTKVTIYKDKSYYISNDKKDKSNKEILMQIDISYVMLSAEKDGAKKMFEICTNVFNKYFKN